MENPTAAESRGSIDRGFLDAVEIEITRALQETADLETGLAEISGGNSDRRDSFVAISENLATWQDRLANLTRQTAVVEADLNEQEHALRDWVEAMGLTITRLTQVSAA